MKEKKQEIMHNEIGEGAGVLETGAEAGEIEVEDMVTEGMVAEAAEIGLEAGVQDEILTDEEILEDFEGISYLIF
jgi:hypothetical protein